MTNKYRFISFSDWAWYHKETIELILTIIGAIIMIFLLIESYLITSEEYNDGICKECGGHYEYVESVGHKHSTSYIYKCDKCGHRIETYELYD